MNICEPNYSSTDQTLIGGGTHPAKKGKMHYIRMIRTNMGRYKAICDCGWTGKTLSKDKAKTQGANHVRKQEKNR